MRCCWCCVKKKMFTLYFMFNSRWILLLRQDVTSWMPRVERSLSWSLEILNISSHLRSFRKSGNFGGSFASISLNTNMFFMKIYHNQRLLLFHNSVKLEYCENLKRIEYRNFTHFLRGFKNSLDFLTWWFGPLNP